MIGYLALGSNQGDSLANLKAARAALEALPEVQIVASSSLYETDPYGPVAQDNFLNAVIRIETTLEPGFLLGKIHQIEADLGRVRMIHWGPRTIDIDILLLDDVKLTTPRLTIPHLEITKRAFVLIPLQDVYQEKALQGKSISEWIEATGDEKTVRLSEKVW